MLPGLLALLPHILWLPGACAQQADRPLLLPTGDVTVIYRFDGVAAGSPHKMQITYAQQGERVRIDYFRWVEAKYPYLALIFDRPANRLISVHAERKAYIDRQIGHNNNPGVLLPPDTLFTRQGESTVANAPCTVWRLVQLDKPDEGGTTCVTDDGIVLRLAATKPIVITLTATNIHYGAPPDGVFDPPAGFRRESPP